MTINGTKFYGMLISAANALDNKQEIINNMNVFPVPDGDTGINMTLTMRTMKNLSDTDSLSDCAKKAADVALRSARGNSGAILSLFFRGMAKAFRGLEEADCVHVAYAFGTGYSEAYKAVMNPTKGTILTVMQKVADRAQELTEDARLKIENLFERLVETAEVALAKTPEQLPKLKEAHVVDAGGYGFVTILKGMLAALKNHPVVLEKEADAPTEEATFADFDAEEITFAYCTECIVQKSEEYTGEDTAEEFHQFLCTVGDSVVFAEDEEIIKLHVHTDHPGQVMEQALRFGSLATVKIENMKLQHSAKVVEQEKSGAKVASPEKKYGFVSVCLGDGIADAFRDIGADRIIHGGQTMNPSTQDIIDAVNLTPSEYVFVLPNNKNIYMVAEQASKLIKDKKVVVIPTRSVPQGIAAMIAFNPDGTPEDNQAAMEDSLSSVVSMSVTEAVRSTTVSGEAIKDGQMLGLVDGVIECVTDSEQECLRKLAKKIGGASYVMVFCGEGVSEEAQAQAEAILREHAPDCEISVMYGGQPLYPYVISVE
ncbi:MAG: DAK2 domain-containing protein [Ruminococcaceae bacterium]|nr:DAK2 domain-containing protein [Oscillospiraceae bacterium]